MPHEASETVLRILKDEAHALRGMVPTFQSAIRLLGAPASPLTEELKAAVRTKIERLSAAADRLDTVAGQLDVTVG